MKKQKIIIIAHNIRSAHNVGALFRTADGFGVGEIVLSGYSPRPFCEKNLYKTKAHKEIAKTALGSEKSILWKEKKTVQKALEYVQKQGYTTVALEQHTNSISFAKTSLRDISQIAIILGNEVSGVHPSILKKCDFIAEIPMLGKKESLNVSVACGAFLAVLRYGKK